MSDNLDVKLTNVGRELHLSDMTGASTKGARFYRLRVRDFRTRESATYALSLRELSVLHMALTSELVRRRAELSRRSDGIFDPFRQPADRRGRPDRHAPDDSADDGGSAG